MRLKERYESNCCYQFDHPAAPGGARRGPNLPSLSIQVGSTSAYDTCLAARKRWGMIEGSDRLELPSRGRSDPRRPGSSGPCASEADALAISANIQSQAHAIRRDSGSDLFSRQPATQSLDIHDAAIQRYGREHTWPLRRSTITSRDRRMRWKMRRKGAGRSQRSCRCYRRQSLGALYGTCQHRPTPASIQNEETANTIHQAPTVDLGRQHFARRGGWSLFRIGLRI